MPILTFSVNDMDTTVPRLLSLGGSLDGPIKYHAIGKVGQACVRTDARVMAGCCWHSQHTHTHLQIATLRAPWGSMVSLHEPADD